MSKNKLEIITTYRIKGCRFWDSNVNFIGYIPINWAIKNRIIKKIVSIIDDLILLVIFLSLPKKYDVLVTYRDRASNIFSMIQGIFGKKIHHIMLNCLWRIPKNRVARFIREKNLKISASGVDRFVVFASHEQKAYHDIFNLPKEKFTYIPYYFTPAASGFKVREGDYIFSGGYHAYRDYQTLIEAVKDLNIKCKIATQSPESFPKINIPSNVEIRCLAQDEFFRSMAESKIVIVPMKKDHFRSTGQRTYLNAMLMGKPLIVCDDKGAFDYIINKQEAIIIPPGNAGLLRQSIEWVLNASKEEMSAMTERAKVKAKTFTIDNTMGRILDLAQEVTGKKL